MPQFQIFTSHLLFLYFILFSILDSFATPNPRNGFSLQLIHRNSLESPFHVGDHKTSQRITTLAKPTNKSHIDPQRLRFDLIDDGDFMYVVKIDFGNPAIPHYFLPDTGSQLFLTQCEPCTRRYRQLPPIYNSSALHPCEHPFCRNNHPTFKCQQGECVYKRTYGDGSETESVVALDVFHLPNNIQKQIFFGCSRNNRNFFYFAHTGRIGGIMGLSMSPVSFVQQLADITLHLFSYCLNPVPTEGNGRSLLRFGDDINIHERRFKSIPIVSPPKQHKYFVTLLDISVERHRMNFSRSIFALKRDGTGGCMIDSGTSVTSIIQPAYGRLFAAFKLYFDSYGLEQVRLHDSTGLDLCYKKSERLLKYASMTYHFQGADFEVEPHHMYEFVNEHDAFCVSLKGVLKRTTLGAMHQINTRFVFDVANRQILFAPEDCERDR